MQIMPINGLLIGLASDTSISDKVVKKLEKNNHVELGERNDMWLPISIETESVRGSHEVHEWIEALDGVLSVDVIFASVEESNKSSK